MRMMKTAGPLLFAAAFLSGCNGLAVQPGAVTSAPASVPLNAIAVPAEPANSPAAAAASTMPPPSLPPPAIAPAPKVSADDAAATPSISPASAPKAKRRQPAPAPPPLNADHPPTAAAATTAEIELHGKVSLVPSGRQAVSAADFAETLVYFVPAAGAPPPRPGHFTVFTNHRDFHPASLVVPLGSKISFVNQDDVRHNVYSVTPGSAFDLGYQAPGETATQVFQHAGVVLVSCNVHHSMETDVLVVPTSLLAHVGADGSFVLRGVPTGPGRIYFWNPRAALISQVVARPEAPIKQSITVVRPRGESMSDMVMP